jgi:hypothetical protein
VRLGATITDGHAPRLGEPGADVPTIHDEGPSLVDQRSRSWMPAPGSSGGAVRSGLSDCLWRVGRGGRLCGG